MKNKIIIVEEAFPTVSETFILDQITGLIGLGYDVENWAFTEGSPAAVHADIHKYNLSEKTIYIHLPENKYENDSGHWLKKFRELNPSVNLESEIVFHIHFGTSFLRLQPLFTAISNKVVVSFHGYDASQVIHTYGKSIYSYLFRRADIVTTPSAAMKRKLIDAGCSEKKIKIHHYGVNPDLFKRSETKDEFQIRILTVARLVEKKGILNSLKAFSKIENKSNLKYRIIGEGPLKDEIIDLINKLNLNQYVELVPFLPKEEINKEFGRSDIFLLPSITSADGDQEGMPVSILEAQSAGLPVVSTFHAGIPEAVKDGVTGLLSPENDIEGIKKNLILLTGNPGLRSEMSAAARENILNNFNILELNRRLALLLCGIKTKSPDPFISICIITYNRATYIREAVESALVQKGNIEIVIIDDGSTDFTREIIEKFNSPLIKYIYQEHLGAPYARNKAVEAAGGDFIIWLDSDDILSHDIVSCYSALTAEHPLVDVFYGNLEVTDGNLNPLNVITYQDWYGKNDELISAMFLQNPVPHAGSLIRKTAYQKHKYNPHFTRAHDYEWWTRQCPELSFKHVDRVFYKWRWHNENMSSGSVKIDTSYDVKVVENLLQMYSLQQLFPRIDWDNLPENKSLSEAYVKTAHRFIFLNNFILGKKYLQKAYELSGNEEIRKTLAGINDKTLPAGEGDSFKILFVVHNFPPDGFAGVENYTFSLARELTRSNIDISVFYPLRDTSLKTPVICTSYYEGIRVFRLLHNEPERLSGQITNESFETLFNDLLQKEKFDLIHFHHLFGMPLSFAETAYRKKIKTVLTLHDHWFICARIHLYIDDEKGICSGPESIEKCSECLSGSMHKNNDDFALNAFFQYRREAVKKVFGYADMIISPSFYLAQKIKSFINTDKIQVLPIGIKCVETDPAEGSLNDRGIVFGFLGTVSRLKNLSGLVKTFMKVKGDAKLLIYAGGEREVISEAVSIAADDPRIEFRGSYEPEQLGSILSGLDAVIIPSFIENYPLVVREALSAKVPVIASEVGGIPEIISGKRFLFDPREMEQLLEILQDVTDNRDKLERARADIKPVKSIEEDAAELISNYKSLVRRDDQIKISIIIPVFNKLDFTRTCIETIYRNTSLKNNFEVIVVDNASSDETPSYLNDAKKKHRNFKTIRNDKNLGFSKANNQAVGIAEGKYLLFLNNDTEPHTGWLEPLVEILDNDPLAGVAGSKLLFPDTTIQHAGVIIFEKENTNPRLNAYHLYYKEPADLPDSNEKRFFQVLTAACFLIRREAFEETGGFDEGFWNGYEDIDLCHKIYNNGWTIIYQPESILTHHESQSGAERFSKVPENVKRLYERWKDIIKPDAVFTPAGLKSTPWSPIQKYIPRTRLKNNSHLTVNLEKVSIIVLTYNQLEYTRQFIESVKKYSDYPYELVLIDNCSTDPTPHYLKELAQNSTNVRIILNKENYGFPKGVNQGIKKASGKYILIANNDIIVTEGWLGRMVDIAKADPSVGIVGPVSNSVSGVQLDKNAVYNSIEEMHVYSKKVRVENSGRSFVFPRAAFLCTLVKKEVFDKIGGLDERFSPGNFEDDDFCLRAQMAGYKTVIAQDVFIHHFGSKSFTAEGTEKYGERLNINKKIFINKWGADPDEIWLRGKSIIKRNILYPLNRNLFIENLQRARIHIEEKEYPAAFTELEKSIELYNEYDNGGLSDLTSLLNLAGNTALILEEYDKARIYFEKALNRDQSSSLACSGLGEVFLNLENYEAAKTMFEWAVVNDPGNNHSADNLAKVNTLLDLPAEHNSLALQESGSAGENHEKAGELIKEAYALYKEEDYQSAYDRLEEAEQLFNGQITSGSDPGFASSFFNMKGFLLLGMNRIDEAKINFEYSLNYNPSSSQACAGLGEVLYLSGLMNSKIMYEWGVKNNPENEFALTRLRKINELLGYPPEDNSLSGEDNG